MSAAQVHHDYNEAIIQNTLLYNFTLFHASHSIASVISKHKANATFTLKK